MAFYVLRWCVARMHSDVGFTGVDYLLDVLDVLDGETETLGKLPFLPSNRPTIPSNRSLFRPIDRVAHVAFELLPARKQVGKHIRPGAVAVTRRPVILNAWNHLTQ